MAEPASTPPATDDDLNPRPGIAVEQSPRRRERGVRRRARRRCLNDQMDPFVFAQLMTSNHKQSDLLMPGDEADRRRAARRACE